jgi:carbonic anhydrase
LEVCSVLVIVQVPNNNTHCSDSFTKGDLPMRPGPKLAALACMDVRLDIHKIPGLDEGDPYLIRDAGALRPMTPSVSS